MQRNTGGCRRALRTHCMSFRSARNARNEHAVTHPPTHARVRGSTTPQLTPTRTAPVVSNDICGGESARSESPDELTSVAMKSTQPVVVCARAAQPRRRQQTLRRSDDARRRHEKAAVARGPPVRDDVVEHRFSIRT